MNIKEIIIPFVFAVCVSTFIQYYFFSSKPKEETPASIVVASSELQKPLNREVDFIEKKKLPPVHSSIDTVWGHLIFSTEGATLETLNIKKNKFPSGTVSTLPDMTALERTYKTFLIGTDQETPYEYELIEESEHDQKHMLMYSAQGPEGTIVKKFFIHQNLPIIDMDITLAPKNGHTMHPRLFIGAPHVASLADDIVSAVHINMKGTFEKINVDKVQQDQAWIAPQLFGLDDRYFVHAMTNDQDHFVQRSYYGFSGTRYANAIFEGPSVTQETTWQVSFYMGPKDADMLKAADPRLEQTLDYFGWFAPISHFLLRLLKWLYSYVHNYGIAIILLTILMKLLMLPLTIKGESSARQQKEMQRKLAYIQQKYKDEPDTLARERAELIKKYGVPGLGGCLPILLQIPIFFSLSRLLANSIELYQAPMWWIPDLSTKDPWYVFPALITVSMLANAATVDDKQKLSVIAMALIFGAFSASFSAGLALYIAVNTLLGVIQTFLMKRFS